MKYLLPTICFIFIAACSGPVKTQEQVNIKKKNVIPKKEKKEKKQLKKEYKSTGWLGKDKYRALIYVIPSQEAKKLDVDYRNDMIKDKAVLSMQRSFGLNFSIKRHRALKNLVNNHGKVIEDMGPTPDDRVYVIDIIKENLRDEIYRIKNIK